MASKLAAWRSWRPVEVYPGDRAAPGLLPRHMAVAIKNVARGEATPEQQVQAIEAIIKVIACIDEQSFRADDHGGERDSVFAEGRRFVGLQLRKLLITPLEILTGERKPQE